MRIVFRGTPEFAVPSLRALCDAGYCVGEDVSVSVARRDRVSDMMILEGGE